MWCLETLDFGLRQGEAFPVKIGVALSKVFRGGHEGAVRPLMSWGQGCGAIVPPSPAVRVGGRGLIHDGKVKVSWEFQLISNFKFFCTESESLLQEIYLVKIDTLMFR